MDEPKVDELTPASRPEEDQPKAPFAKVAFEDKRSLHAAFEGKGSLHAVARQFGNRPVEIVGERWVQIGRRLPGRPPLDQALIQRLQTELEEHLCSQETEPKQADSALFVIRRLKVMQKSLSDDAIERKIVQEAHRKRWPKDAES
jgi:hypothetical protein